jgi:hypothetical protein
MPMIARTTIRWADREYDELKGYADRKNISLSAAIREVTLKHIPEQSRQRHFPWFS